MDAEIGQILDTGRVYRKRTQADKQYQSTQNKKLGNPLCKLTYYNDENADLK